MTPSCCREQACRGPVLPALLTTNGMLIGISTPYRRMGLLHTKHRDHYGVSDDDVLVRAPGDLRQVRQQARRCSPELERAVAKREPAKCFADSARPFP